MPDDKNKNSLDFDTKIGLRKTASKNQSSDQSGQGTSLKKPSDISAASVPGIQLKKPGVLSAPSGGGSLSLKKPGVLSVPSGGGGSLSLKKPGEAMGGGSLKPPTLSAPTPLADSAKEESPPATMELKKLSQLGVPSKLSTSGNLELKKNTESSSGTADPVGSGLRLRKPSEAEEESASDKTSIGLKKPTNLSAPEAPKPGIGLTPPKSTAPSASDPNDDTTLDLKIKKTESEGKKLGLAAPKPASARSVIPPGLEPPKGVLSKPAAAKDKESENKDKDEKVDDESAAERKPAAEIKFARKTKKKLTKPQKIQFGVLALIGAVIFVLGIMFVINLFTASKLKKRNADDIAEASKKTKVTIKRKVAEKVVEPVEENYEPAAEIAFPASLIAQLEKEQGKEVKAEFMAEWDKLMNHERKKYLIEIEAWEDDYEVEDGVMVMHFDEDEGALEFQDSSGNGHHGKSVEGTAPTAGKAGLFGSALMFDGEDDFLTIPASKSLNIKDKITIEVWFKAIDYEKQGPILEWSAGKKMGVHMMMNSKIFQWRGEGAGVNFKGKSGKDKNHIINVSKPAENTWHYIVVTFSNTIGVAKMYLNGKLVEKKSLGPIKLQTGYDIHIGASRVLKDTYFSGLIDEVAIYDRIVTKDEILKRYKRGQALTDE